MVGFVIAPSLRGLSPTSAMEFNSRVLPRVVRAMQGLVGSTLLFGVLLLYAFEDGNFSGFENSSDGRAISAGVVFGLAAAVVAFVFTFPALKRMASISQTALQNNETTLPPDLVKQASRARMGATASVVLLLIALAAMVAAGFYY